MNYSTWFCLGGRLCRGLAHDCCEQSVRAGPWVRRLLLLRNENVLGALVCALWASNMKSRQSMTLLSKLSFSCHNFPKCPWPKILPRLAQLQLHHSWPGNCDAQRNSTASHRTLDMKVVDCNTSEGRVLRIRYFWIQFAMTKPWRLFLRLVGDVIASEASLRLS